MLEFNAGFDNERGSGGRRREGRCDRKRPAARCDDKVVEINLALFPVVTLLLSGDVPDRALNQLAKRLGRNRAYRRS